MTESVPGALDVYSCLPFQFPPVDPACQPPGAKTTNQETLRLSNTIDLKALDLSGLS
jgi:hypothetical protein